MQKGKLRLDILYAVCHINFEQLVKISAQFNHVSYYTQSIRAAKHLQKRFKLMPLFVQVYTLSS